jgi:hypothetical protein
MTFKTALFPAERKSGKASPLMLKPLPVTSARDKLMSRLPVLVMLTVCDRLLPTSTFPKPNADGATEICCA